MTVLHILNDKGRDVVTIDGSATLADAVRRLTEKRIGAVLVMAGDQIAGILSERDVVMALAKLGPAGLDNAVSDCMSKNVTTCGHKDTIDDVMEMMTTGRFRHVPVVEEGRLVGIISIGDVVKARIAEVVREAEEMRGYIATA